MVAAGKVPFSDQALSSDASMGTVSAAAPSMSRIATVFSYPSPALKRS